MNQTERFLKRIYPSREYPLILIFESVDFSKEFIEENDFVHFIKVREGSKTLFLSKVINNKEELYTLSQNLTRGLETLFKPLEGLSHEDIERQLYEIVLVSTVISELITRLLLYTY